MIVYPSLSSGATSAWEMKESYGFPAGASRRCSIAHVHGDIGRREFLDGANRFAAGGALTAAALLGSLRANYAWRSRSPRTTAGSRPAWNRALATGKWGDSWIPGPAGEAQREVARSSVRTRELGPEPLDRGCGTPSGHGELHLFLPHRTGRPAPAATRAMTRKVRNFSGRLQAAQMTGDFLAAAYWLKAVRLHGQSGRGGFLVFGCGRHRQRPGRADGRRSRRGGSIRMEVQPPAADAGQDSKAPLPLHYASLDTRINAGWPAYQEASKANQVTFTAYMYEGRQSWFPNDTTPRYDEAAAQLAWRRTLDFFEQVLEVMLRRPPIRARRCVGEAPSRFSVDVMI